MKKILLTGANGQLGQCFRKKAEDFPDLELTYTGSAELDLGKKEAARAFLQGKGFDYCINCAAYTKVEEAEKERETAFHINAEAVQELAVACRESGVTLIHFSTDYVFDGSASTPYSETDKTAPLNVYGASKLQGEKLLAQELKEHFIFRTSWLYSDVGHNFFKTILRKAGAGETLNITTSQRGTPTNAYDLAEFVLNLILQGSTEYGLYHYSNRGEATWYDFAEEILRLSGKRNRVTLNKTGAFKTLATRPAYSVLSKEKALEAFRQEIKPWRQSLRELLEG